MWHHDGGKLYMFLIQQTQLLELIFLHTIGCVDAREAAQELGKKKVLYLALQLWQSGFVIRTFLQVRLLQQKVNDYIPNADSLLLETSHAHHSNIKKKELKSAHPS